MRELAKNGEDYVYFLRTMQRSRRPGGAGLQGCSHLLLMGFLTALHYSNFNSESSGAASVCSIKVVGYFQIFQRQNVISRIILNLHRDGEVAWHGMARFIHVFCPRPLLPHRFSLVRINGHIKKLRLILPNHPIFMYAFRPLKKVFSHFFFTPFLMYILLCIDAHCTERYIPGVASYNDYSLARARPMNLMVTFI